MKIVRSSIFHTPGGRLVYIEDGALAVDRGRIIACDDYAVVRKANPDAAVRGLRDGFLVPGFIDTHTHFPQVRILGGLGHSLLDWLDRLTLPEEARLADPAYARGIAGEFVHHLASHGTTTALVFGAHFAEATASLFHAAETAGLRVIAGLVLADRMLRPELLQTPDAAYQDSQALIDRFNGQGNLRYAVIPRFALSASEPMLEVCESLMKANPGVHFTSHINENPHEVKAVAELFPWAKDYLDVYERFSLTGAKSVFAHNIYARDSELSRLAQSGTAIAHCPCSNAALGSGIFPMQRHMDSGVPFALGTDVGGGTGFGIMKEALQAHLLQRLAPDPVTVSSARMLYLATLAGAEALGIADETGDFSVGKSADFVYLEAPAKSPLAGVLGTIDSPERILAALFTLAGQECIREVRVGGDLVYSQ